MDVLWIAVTLTLLLAAKAACKDVIFGITVNDERKLLIDINGKKVELLPVNEHPFEIVKVLLETSQASDEGEFSKYVLKDEALYGIPAAAAPSHSEGGHMSGGSQEESMMPLNNAFSLFHMATVCFPSGHFVECHSTYHEVSRHSRSWDFCILNRCFKGGIPPSTNVIQNILMAGLGGLSSLFCVLQESLRQDWKQTINIAKYCFGSAAVLYIFDRLGLPALWGFLGLLALCLYLSLWKAWIWVSKLTTDKITTFLAEISCKAAFMAKEKIKGPIKAAADHLKRPIVAMKQVVNQAKDFAGYNGRTSGYMDDGPSDTWVSPDDEQEQIDFYYGNPEAVVIEDPPSIFTWAWSFLNPNDSSDSEHEAYDI